MLAAILESADRRANDAAQRVADLSRRAAGQSRVRGFENAVRDGRFGVVAEIKRRSPSAGEIAIELDPVRQALAYEAGGAVAISVLTEPDFFGGSLDDLVAVRDAVNVPVLRKDFTRNGAQLIEARAHGADAALLIVATLTQPTLVALCEVSRDIGIDVIVEVHTEEELDRAIEAGASMIGVNNRDLSTFQTDLGTAEMLGGKLPSRVVSIAESGVSSAAGAERMREANYDAVLVGEALMRAEDPRVLVSILKGSQ